MTKEELIAKMAASATDVLFGRSTAGAGAGEEIACTSAGRALLDDANASAQRTTLGLGTAAVVDTGTGAANVPTTAQADVRYAAASHGVHVTDGDKGDITVASSGAAWTLDASAHLGLHHRSLLRPHSSHDLLGGGVAFEFRCHDADAGCGERRCVCS